MGYDGFRDLGKFSQDLNLERLIDEAKGGRVGGARAPKKQKTHKDYSLSHAGVLALLLGVEGCKTVTPGGLEPPGQSKPPGGGGNSGGGSGGGGTTPPLATAPVVVTVPAGEELIAVHENMPATISLSQVLGMEPDARSFVAISAVANGVAHVVGDSLVFTPAAGFEGTARITFTFRDSSGAVKTGELYVNVDDDAHDHDHGEEPGATPPPPDEHDHDHGTPAPHTDDPTKQKEHLALLDLVPVSGATHIAVKSGSWFDPSTWANGQVPGDGAKVLVPTGIAVAYDGSSPASIFTVRVDGELNFATNKNTFLEVDTMVIAPKGTLTIGTENNPVDPNIQAVISIAANGPINVAWDPMLLSRGVISHGTVEIHGAEKENFIAVAVDPMKGDTSMLLSDAPEGWRVGDKIVITGTHLNSPGNVGDDKPRTGTTQDEALTIVKIEGDRVFFDKPLQFDHDTPRDDLKAYVANYTRNIRIETEGGDSVPVSQRGHVMFMHSDEISVNYAEFFELGRTDKSVRSFDVTALTSVASDTNVQGRYPLHIHRAGFADLSDPAIVVGNAVWGSPGWGFVHHDSNAIMSSNNAFDVFGASFVAETGTETGRWADNIAIRGIGVNTHPKDAEDYHAFDFARAGIGFWFQGRMVDAVGNVAAGMMGHGFVYNSRIPSSHELFVDPENVVQGEKHRYLDSVRINEPNIGLFLNNEVIASYRGLEIIKIGPRQENDVRSVLENFTAWEVVQGALIEYTGHYTLKNFDLVATESDFLRHDTLIGLWYGNNSFDIVLNGADIFGFDRAVQLNHNSLLAGVTDHRYIFIDMNTDAPIPYNGLLAQDKILSSSQLVDRALVYDSGLPDIVYSGPDKLSDPPLILIGTKTDSIGTTPTSTDWDPFIITYFSIRGATEQNGYWQTADGKLVTLIEEYFADRATGALEKVGIWVELPSGMSLVPENSPYAWGVRVEPKFHGLLDLDNKAPIAVDDYATVEAGKSVVIDVLANDSDPEGREIQLDQIFATYGHVVANKDGTVTYFADPGFSGVDSFFYWVQDDQGNFSKAMVTVTVEI